MKQSICSERTILRWGAGRCRRSQGPCGAFRAIFCITWDLAKFACGRVAEMFLQIETE